MDYPMRPADKSAGRARQRAFTVIQKCILWLLISDQPDQPSVAAKSVIDSHRKVGEFDENAPPIWETVEALGKEIPDEEWAKLPNDASINLDHYLYEHRQRSE
jgi:hypothetical protein